MKTAKTEEVLTGSAGGLTYKRRLGGRYELKMNVDRKAAKWAEQMKRKGATLEIREVGVEDDEPKPMTVEQVNRIADTVMKRIATSIPGESSVEFYTFQAIAEEVVKIVKEDREHELITRVTDDTVSKVTAGEWLEELDDRVRTIEDRQDALEGRKPPGAIEFGTPEGENCGILQGQQWGVYGPNGTRVARYDSREFANIFAERLNSKPGPELFFVRPFGRRVTDQD